MFYRLTAFATAALFPLNTAHSTPSLPPPTQEIQLATFEQRCQPIADLIAQGEGTWNSVNRGRAGDTPGGIKSITGREFRQMTVEEVLWLQRGSVYAVGRYQLIPTTMKLAVKWSKVAWSEKFTNEVQNKLFCTLLSHKRPQIGRYLLGEGSLQLALDSLAKEWASVAYRGPYSYYSGIGGNRAHITMHQATVALNTGRAL